MDNKKFGLRTIFIPAGAIAGFFIIQTICVTLFTIIFILLNPEYANTDPTEAIYKFSNEMAIAYSAAIIISAILAIIVIRLNDKTVIQLEKPNIMSIVPAIVIMLGAAGLVTLLMAGIMSLSDNIPLVNMLLDEYEQLSQLFVGSGNVALIIISTAFLVPIAEELVFRGIIQSEIRRAFPAWVAILVQAVIFALVHGNAIQISYVIIPAIALGIVYEWTKSLYIPILMHIAFNFVGAALPQIFIDNETILSYIALGEIAMIPLGIIAFFYLRKIRKSEPLETQKISEE